MTVNIYAKGLTASVIDGAPTPPASVGGSGNATVYAKGLTVDVQTVGAFAPVTHSVPLNLSKLLLFDAHFNSGSSYQRRMYHVCLTADAFSLPWGTTMTGGTLPLAYPKYGLYFGDGDTLGTLVTTYVRKSTERGGSFVGNLGTLADGPYMLSIVPQDANGVAIVSPTECPVPFWIWVDRNGQAKDSPWVIKQNGSFDWVHSDGPVYLWAKVPKSQMKTRSVPLNFTHIPAVDTPLNSQVPHRFYSADPFSTALPNTSITRLNYANSSDNSDISVYRPCLTKRGITVTENNQAYSVYDFYAAQPNQPQLDGPRGVAVVTNPNALWIGHAGSIYGCDGHAFWRVGPDGVKRTFAGIRHKYAPYWEEIQPGQPVHPAVEIVGDWDVSIPPEKRWPWESWGLVFDLRSVTLDPSLPTVQRDPFGMLPQHLNEGPVAFATCRFGRILKFQFHKARPNDPPTITEWVTGLSDPWGMALVGNTLYVCERLSHKISTWSADTAQTPLGDVISNPSGATFGHMDDAMRTFKLDVPLATARAQQILAPEGLAALDGYLYWGQLSTGEVRRINLATKAIDICCRVPFFTGDQPHFISIAISDGTFGPRGTLFTSTADNQNLGRPCAFLPVAGVASDGVPLTNSKRWDWVGYSPHVIRGPGGTTPAVYPMGIGVGNGVLAHGSSGYGLDVFMQNTVGDPATNYASATRGHQYYNAKGYRLIYGNYGWGFVDTPLPWGENPDMDYWLQLSGHK